MTPQAEQQVAKRLLQIRTTGYTARAFLATQWRVYAAYATVFGLAAAFYYSVNLPEVAKPFVWVIAGVMLRDLSWFRAYKSAWPLNERIIDWAKVRRIADGDEPPALPPAA